MGHVPTGPGAPAPDFKPTPQSAVERAAAIVKAKGQAASARVDEAVTAAKDSVATSPAANAGRKMKADAVKFAQPAVDQLQETGKALSETGQAIGGTVKAVVVDPVVKGYQTHIAPPLQQASKAAGEVIQSAYEASLLDDAVKLGQDALNAAADSLGKAFRGKPKPKPETRLETNTMTPEQLAKFKQTIKAELEEMQGAKRGTKAAPPPPKPKN